MTVDFHMNNFSRGSPKWNNSYSSTIESTRKLHLCFQQLLIEDYNSKSYQPSVFIFKCAEIFGNGTNHAVIRMLAPNVCPQFSRNNRTGYIFLFISVSCDKTRGNSHGVNVFTMRSGWLRLHSKWLLVHIAQNISWSLWASITSLSRNGYRCAVICHTSDIWKIVEIQSK